MSRSKGRTIKDQKSKLVVLGEIFGWRKSIAWEEAFEISPGSFTNWMKEKPINKKNIGKIVSRIQSLHPSFSLSDLDLPFADFCVRLGHEPKESNTDFSNTEPFKRRKLGDTDIQIMRNLARNSCILFLARDGRNDEKPYIAVERVEILPYSENKASCAIRQRKNQISADSPSGLLRSTNERVSILLSYEEYYSESLYLAVPIFFRGNVLLFGFYLDVSPLPVKEVFAVKFLLLPEFSEIHKHSRIYKKDRFYVENKDGFDNLIELLKDEKPEGRKRFVIPNDRQTTEHVCDVVDALLRQ